LIWFVAVLAIAAAGAAGVETPIICLFRRLTGVPCVTCGLSRGVALILFEGRVLEGWWHNPLVFSLLALVALLSVIRSITGRSYRLRLRGRLRALAWAGAACLVLGNWLYLILSEQ
jgi:hypothetical protein